ALAEFGVLNPKDAKDTILLRRAAEGDWKTVKLMSRLQTGELLVTLAGYRSELLFDNRMRVQMVGRLPNPRPASPNPHVVMESALTLHQPSEGVDLDLTLERGRIIIFNKKPDPSTVRLRFLDQVWDLRLTQPTSTVGLEISGRVPVSAGNWQP